jgi:hypothetical protein
VTEEQESLAKIAKIAKEEQKEISRRDAETAERNVGRVSTRQRSVGIKIPTYILFLASELGDLCDLCESIF